MYFRSDPDVLIDKKIKEIKKVKDDSKENFDFMDIEKNSHDGFLAGAIGTMSEMSPFFAPDLCNIGVLSSIPDVRDTAEDLQLVGLDKLEIGTPDGATTVEKDNEISSCVVCEKKFKSKSCMNKHLRSVHAGLLLYHDYYHIRFVT